MKQEEYLTEIKKDEIAQEYALLELKDMIDIPADLLLYWISKQNGFQNIIEEADISLYSESLYQAHQQLKISQMIAIHYPTSQSELFQKIVSKKGENGFQIIVPKTRIDKEIYHYRLTRLALFFQQQPKQIQEMLLFAQKRYEQLSKTQESTHTFLENCKQKIYQKFHKAQ